MSKEKTEMALKSDYPTRSLKSQVISGDFRRRDFTGADFYGASLFLADFRGACLRGADFRYATLGGVDFRGAILEDVIFMLTRYDEETYFPKGFPPRSPACYRFVSGERITHAVLDDMFWAEGNLAKVDVSYSSFRRAGFVRCDFSQAIFRGVDLSYAYLINCDLSNSELQGAVLKNCRLTGANLSGASIGKGRLNGALIDPGTILPVGIADNHGALMLRPDSNFIQVNLSGAFLSDMDLHNCDFSGAIFRKSYLAGTNLSDCTLSNADFTNAIYTLDTVWPPGFDPKMAKAIIRPHQA
jgi:uncharacterized protein YjbI with pentapeptide repeats